MRNLKILLFLFLSTFVFNCLSTPVIAFFGRTKHHISTGNKNTLASNQILKVGESCSYSSYFGNLFYLYYGVGGGVNEAMEKAGISKVAVIDRSSMSIFPIYYEDCILVYGE